MYSIFVNQEKIYDDTTSELAYALTGAVLNLEAGAAGSLEIRIPQTNVIYDRIQPVVDFVDVYRQNELIFSGRAYSIDKDYNGIISVVFEGLLAVFNDTVLRPADFNDTLEKVIAQIVDIHNSQVDQSKKVVIGEISIPEAKNYVFRGYENYESIKTRLDDFVSSFGGYLRIRKQDDGLYLDWLADYGITAKQTIDFGYNLLDLRQAADVSEIITVLIPLGADLEDANGNRKPLTISSVNSGKDYIENAAGIARYGRIIQTATWNDVTTPEALLTKGTNFLNNASRGRVQINVNAVDMSKAGSSVESWKLGDKVTVNAALFGVDGEEMMIQALKLDLQNPAGNQLQLNSTRVGFIGKTSAHNNSVRITIENMNNDISEEIQKVIQKVTEYTSGINQTAKDITLFAKVINGTASTSEIESWENTELKISAQGIAAEIENSKNQSLWITVSAEDGVTIGRKQDETGTNDPTVVSKQDNDSYEFIDLKTNTTLMKIDIAGMTASTANVTGQLTMLNGQTKQWAIRKGKYITGVGVNLNDVWIG